MSDQGVPCGEKGRTCAEIRWTDGRDCTPQESEDCFTMIVDIVPDSPAGCDFERGRIKFCPFCGEPIEVVW